MYSSTRLACHTDRPPRFKVTDASGSRVLLSWDSVARRLEASLRQRHAMARLVSKSDIARPTRCPTSAGSDSVERSEVFELSDSRETESSSTLSVSVDQVRWVFSWRKWMLLFWPRRHRDRVKRLSPWETRSSMTIPPSS